MKAVALTRYLPIDNPGSLVDVDLPKPQPGGHDLLVAVKAIAVNPVDTKVRSPKDKVEPSPRVIGYDAAGVVEAVGPDVTLFKVGDEVFYAGDITRAGTNSEFHLADERVVGRKPKSLSVAEAAALPLTSITAYEVLFDRIGIDAGGRDKGKTLLIIGGAGGVGSIAIQLAKLAGQVVVTTASRPETIDWVRKLGADHVINHRQPLKPQLDALGLTNIDNVAVFNDTDQHWNAAVEIVKPQGTIGLIVENAKPLDQSVAKGKSVKLAWEMMFTRAMYKTPDMIEQHNLLNKVSAWIDDGTLRTTANDAMTPINAANLRKAHKALEEGSVIGKITLEGW
ncbi:MAG: zinc-binding alcohol dehydrogenase family protein [Hyphomicrobiaceae bacterium]|nr:zinc-binding alcohol dehydrogenase family protein [Hyphomicrobiaceae bacterium]